MKNPLLHLVMSLTVYPVGGTILALIFVFGASLMESPLLVLPALFFVLATPAVCITLIILSSIEINKQKQAQNK